VGKTPAEFPHEVRPPLLARGASLLRRLAALALKELRMILKDPRSRFAIIVPPIIQLVVFGYAANYDVNNLPLVVLDQSRTSESRALVAAFEASPAFERVATVDSTDQLRDLVTRQQARVALHIGPTFARDLAAGRPAPVQVIADGRSSNTAAIAAGYASQIIANYNARLPTAPPTTNAAGARPPGHAVLVDRAWFNPNFLSRWFFVPAIIVELVLVEVLLLSALSVAREREQGTFDQLLVAPYATWELLVGKAAPGLLIGLPQGLLAVIVAVLWFGVPLRGSLPALVIGLLVFVACTTGVGLFISSLARTMQQALLGTFLFMMPAVLLSGLTTPVEDMPGWIRTLTIANPLKYALHIGRDTFIRGSGLAAITPDLVPLCIIALIALAAAGIMFRLRAQ
jgi:ABC-2 type transport system permease protein